jgi:MFS family permease
VTRDLRLVGLSLATWGTGEGLFFIFLPLYLRQLGAEPAKIGTVLGLSSAAMAVSLIPAGALADHFGRRALMIAGWVIGVVCGGVMFLAGSLPLFVVAVVAYGFTGFVLSPLNSYVISARGSYTPARALGFVGSLYHAGAIVGAGVGGWIGQAVGLRYVFLVATALFVVSTAVVLFARHQPVETPLAGQRYQPLLRNTAFGRFLLITAVAVFALYLGTPLAPNYLQEVHSVPLRTIGAFGSLMEVGIVLFNLALPRVGPRSGLLIAHLLLALGLLSLWRGGGVAWFGLGYLLVGAFRTARLLLVAQADMYLPRAQIGLAYGVLDTVATAMMVIAAPIAGWLFGLNPDAPFRAGLLLAAASLLVQARGLPPAQGERHDLPRTM